MRVRKRFGQHFLEPAWVRKLLDALDARPDDTFLEIGPGRGAVTLPLASRVRRLVVVEIDRDLAADLERRVPENVTVVTADFLETDLRSLAPAGARPFRVVGNLPYYISTPILFRLIEAAEGGRFLSDATLMLQREVADRLAARPGDPDYGVLSIMVQVQADVRRVLELPPGAFRPPPKVSSAVVRIEFGPRRPALGNLPLFEEMVRAMFGQRRKTLANALKGFAEARGVRAAEALAKAGIEPTRRPETLELPELVSLLEVFASGFPPDVL